MKPMKMTTEREKMRKVIDKAFDGKWSYQTKAQFYIWYKWALEKLEV